MKTDRSRQETIQRLQSFLRDSINLEPELERFICSLIVLLENPMELTAHAGQNNTGQSEQFKDIYKIQH